MSSGLFNSKPLHISQADSFEITIESFLRVVLGIERENWAFIGSFGKKEFSGDVDIAVLDDYDRVVSVLKKCGIKIKEAKGFNQISFGYPFEGQIVQVDLMLSKNLEWSKFIYHSPRIPEESQCPGIYRNLLLSSLIITESRYELDDGSIKQLILRLNEGLVCVHKSFSGKVSKIIGEEFVTNNSTELANYFQLQEPILIFEELWNQVNVRPKLEEIKERFEKFCKQSKITIPNYEII